MMKCENYSDEGKKKGWQGSLDPLVSASRGATRAAGGGRAGQGGEEGLAPLGKFAHYHVTFT